MTAVPLPISSYGIEGIYLAAWLLSTLAAVYLAKWTTRGLLAYVFTVAVLIVIIEVATDVYRATAPRTYSVAVPCAYD